MVNVSQKRDQLIRISYAPSGQGSQPHYVFIPWTDEYNKALESAKNKLKRFFPPGTDDEFRWLAVKAESGTSWTELDADVFPAIAQELKDKAELRLSENYKPKNVTVLPLDHDDDTYYQFKIIVIGEPGVGKTMLLQYFTKAETDRMDSPGATTKIRQDISSRFMTNDRTLLKAELWDTAGSEKYRSLTQSTYRNVNGVLLVYNLTKKETFEKCEEWRKDLKRNIDNFTEVQVVLVGNQVDIEDQREVSMNEAQTYADQHGLKFAEVSAKEGTNVEQTFQTLMDAIFESLNSRVELVQYQKSKQQQRQNRVLIQNTPKRGDCKC